MIHMKLISGYDYVVKRDFVRYEEDLFAYIADTAFRKVSELPFRDKESIFLMRELGYEFENADWYSVTGEEGKRSIFGLPKEVKYALCAVFYSREGIPVTHESFCSKEFAAPVPKTEDPFSDGLFLGKDGRYYIWTWDVGNVYRYLWKNDIENMISYIEKREYNEKCLTYISQAYSFSQFMHQVARYPEIYQAEELCDRNTPEIISHMSWYPIESICRKLPFLFVTKYEDW